MNTSIKLDIKKILEEIFNNTLLDDTTKQYIKDIIIKNLKNKNNTSFQIETDVYLYNSDIVDYFRYECSDYDIRNILYDSHFVYPVCNCEKNYENKIQNLDDYYRNEIVQELFKKCSWEELENIKKSLNI